MVQLKARLANGTITSIHVNQMDDTSVEELKQVIHSSTGESIETMRLVVNGRILQRDDHFLSAYSIAEGDIVHVARTRPQSTSPTRQSPPSPDPLDNPMINSLLENPGEITCF